LGREVMINFLAHFNSHYLFISGDSNPRHSIQWFGLFYPHEYFLVLFGLWRCIKQRSSTTYFLGWWIVIGILPAAISKAAPHALRTLVTLPVWMFIVTQGIWQLHDWVTEAFSGQRKKLAQLGVVTAVSMSYLGVLIMFGRAYYFWYPAMYGQEWQYGYEEVITKLERYQEQFDGHQLAISRGEGRPAMYYWFYTQTNPQKVQAANATVLKDQGEYLSFEDVTFFRTIEEIPAGPHIVALKESEYQNFNNHRQNILIDTVLNKNGVVVWYLVRVLQ
jgi:hypothetical protein